MSPGAGDEYLARASFLVEEDVREGIPWVRRVLSPALVEGDSYPLAGRPRQWIT